MSISHTKYAIYSYKYAIAILALCICQSWRTIAYYNNCVVWLHQCIWCTYIYNGL